MPGLPGHGAVIAFTRCGVSTMRHASYHIAETVSPEPVLHRQKTGQSSIFGSIFARVLAALHHSRRLQAQRVLRQYQHLIGDPKEFSKQISQNNFNPDIGDEKKCR
jgi:hypothetical protein